MPNRLEDELRQLPHFSPPLSFRDGLRAQLNALHQPTSSRFSRFRFIGFSLATLVLAVIVVLANNNRSFAPQPVSAAEIIQVFMNSHFQPGVILHRQTWQYGGTKSDYKPLTGRYFDLWSDQESDRFFQAVTDPTYGTEWQGTTPDFTYHIRPGEQRIVLFPSTLPVEERELKHEQESDIALWLNELLADQTLIAYPGSDQNRPVYIIHDNRNSIDKFWDTFYFDLNSKQLLAVEKEHEGYFSRIDYVLIESLERNTHNLGRFDFPPADVDITGLDILAQVTNAETGEYELLPATITGEVLDAMEEDELLIEVEDMVVEEISEVVEEKPITQSFYESTSSLTFDYPNNWQFYTSSGPSQPPTITFSVYDQDIIHLLVSSNFNQETNAPYQSLSEFFRDNPNRIPFRWSDTVAGEMIEADGSKLYAWFNPTKELVLTIKMSSNLHDTAKRDIEQLFASARFE